jgi:hypothetical protein
MPQPFMANSIDAKAKKQRGRPVSTGTGPVIGVRMRDAPLANLDNWIAGQAEDGLTRPEAIRRLVAIGLSAPPVKSSECPNVLSTGAESAARAAKLAVKNPNPK